MPKLKYDLYNFFNALQSGYHAKLTKVEKALENVSKSFNTVGLFDKHAIVLNEASGEIFRINYEIKPNSVLFENPVKVEITDTKGKFAEKQKDVITNIIESLEKGDNLLVEAYKEKLFNLIREELKLKRILNVELTGKSIYADAKIQKLVAETVSKAKKSTKTLLAEAKSDKTPINSLLQEGRVEIALNKKMVKVEETPEQKIKQQITEARKSAKALFNNPKFAELVMRLEMKKDDAEDYVELLENFQEIFTLTMKEKAQIFKKVYDAAEYRGGNNKRIVEVLSNLRKLATFSINEELTKLDEIIKNPGGQFARSMKLFEAEINTGVYSNIDISDVANIIETILADGSEFMAPEMVLEFKKAQIDIKMMIESGLIDDRQLGSIVNLIHSYMPSQASAQGTVVRP